jgi:hypothetical protein
MKSYVPLAVAGIGILWWMSRKDEDMGEFGQEVVTFGPDFDPAEYAFDEGEFGWWWTKRAKARRRDRKRRRAARWMNKHQKCVAKKGAEHKRCQRLKEKSRKKAEKNLLKAQELEDKLIAKDVVTTARIGKSGKIQTGRRPPAHVQQKFQPSAASYTEEEVISEGQMAPAGATAGPPAALLVVGGLALVGVGGFLIFTLTKKPKRPKRRHPERRRKKAA